MFIDKKSNFKIDKMLTSLGPCGAHQTKKIS